MNTKLSIAIMVGIGNLFDSIVSLVAYLFLLKNIRKNY